MYPRFHGSFDLFHSTLRDARRMAAAILDLFRRLNVDARAARGDLEQLLSTIGDFQEGMVAELWLECS